MAQLTANFMPQVQKEHSDRAGPKSKIWEKCTFRENSYLIFLGNNLYF